MPAGPAAVHTLQQAGHRPRHAPVTTTAVSQEALIGSQRPPVRRDSPLGGLIYVGVIVVLHFLPTGYSPVHNAVSDYGAGRYSSLIRISLWSGSIAVLAL